MGSLDKVLMFVSSHTGLAFLFVHIFKLRSCVLLYFALDDLDDFFIISQAWSLALEPNHVQGGCSLQRAMDMEVFAWVLSLVKIRRHTSVAVGLGSQQIRVCYSQYCFVIPYISLYRNTYSSALFSQLGPILTDHQPLPCTLGIQRQWQLRG